MPDENSQKKVETNAGHPQHMIGTPYHDTWASFRK